VFELAKLSSEARKDLPKSKFAEPGSRKFPIEDRSHAANAKARASEMANKGKISKSEKAKVDRAADKVLKRK